MPAAALRLRSLWARAALGAALLPAALCGPLAAGASAQAVPDRLPAHSDKVVRYDIRAALEEDGATIQGTVRAAWRNPAPGATREQLWHVYNNAWAGRDSLWLRESRLLGDERLPLRWGGTSIQAVRLVPSGGGDAPGELSWAWVAQAGAPDDRTVMRVALPEEVPPGGEVTVEVEFRAELPPAFRRSGTDGKGGHVHAVQWFPKLGVFEELDGELVWNCQPYRYLAEFYADFGDYRVVLTLPKRYEERLASSGSVVAKESGAAAVSYTLIAEDVHDFAWTADPDALLKERDFDPADPTWRDAAEEQRVAAALGRAVEEVVPGKTRMILMLQPEHAEYEEDYFTALGKAIYYFGLWYGSYPYPTISLIDPAHDAAHTGGMEYPRLITGGADKGFARRTLDPESVTVHEFGHQFWYGLVANDEFRHAWLDEGFNTHSTSRILKRSWPPELDTYSVLGRQYYGRALLAFPPYEGRAADWRAFLTRRRVDSTLLPFLPFLPEFSWRLGEETSLEKWLRELPPVSYLPEVEQDAVWSRRGTFDHDWSDSLARPTYELLENSMRRVNAYDRPALFLETLAGLMGEERFTRVMRAYHERWRFRHPRPDDFFAVLKEYATGATVGPEPGVAVDWAEVWRQGYLENATLDFGVHRVVNLAVVEDPQALLGGADGTDSLGLSAEIFDVHVEVRRYGDFRVPVEIEVSWSDGSTSRHSWDGRAEWTRLSFPSSERRAVRAVVDPERRLLLDCDWLNNARRTHPDETEARRLGWRALLWTLQVLHYAGGLG